MIAPSDGFLSIETLLVRPDWGTKIRRKAGQIRRRPAFRHEPFNDIVCDLESRLWQRLRNAKVTRASADRFLARGLKQSVADLIRERETNDNEFNRCAASLSTISHDAACNRTELHEPISRDLRRRNPHRDLDKEIDVDDHLSKPWLRVRDRDVADGLMIEPSRAAVARRLDVPRATSFESIKRLRVVLSPLQELPPLSNAVT